MQKVFFMRHAETHEWHDDFSRPLTNFGKKQAVASGAFIKEQAGGAEKCLSIVSPSVRTIETSDAMFDGLSNRAAPFIVDKLYDYNNRYGFEEIRHELILHNDWPYSSIVIGHNPMILGLCVSFLKPEYRDQILSYGNFKHCQVIEVLFNTKDGALELGDLGQQYIPKID